MKRDPARVCSFLPTRYSILSCLEDTMVPGASEHELSKGERALDWFIKNKVKKIALISITNEITEKRILLPCLVSVNSFARMS